MFIVTYILNLLVKGFVYCIKNLTFYKNYFTKNRMDNLTEHGKLLYDLTLKLY